MTNTFFLKKNTLFSKTNEINSWEDYYIMNKLWNNYPEMKLEFKVYQFDLVIKFIARFNY